ncbi:hypothetical protein N7468_001553 [Penicillium chermesinum]|uniref:U6 snRNA-associated Sm-like protein LSm3 n=1 Tax=Penicillium chermesinum TaxID=63820 RepID=A0A9W9PH12_9EURO|nr:uncharacterized protein N7468_001553 [Penicillium chermesinum]KAJ5246570.1 hypothetical protein N7468_001553 [Penicillium chermesinum]
MADNEDTGAPVAEPLDLGRLHVSITSAREPRHAIPPPDRTTTTQAYDSHCNLVLGDVEETIYVVDEDDETEENLRTIKKQEEMLFVRG